MEDPMTASRTLVRKLMQEMTETLDQLSGLSDADLDQPSAHGCAMNGGLRRLLIHNAEHDRLHAAAVAQARYDNGQMQESELARLLRDWLRERVELVGQLLASPDTVIGLKARNDDWDVAKQVEHVTYWERDSVNVAIAEAAERR
jgi:hypothetical protein